MSWLKEWTYSYISPYVYMSDVADGQVLNKTIYLFDKGIREFVFDVFTNLVSRYTEVINDIFIIWFAFWFIGILIGSVQSDLRSIAATLFLMVFVHIFIFQWYEIAGVLYGLFTNGPSQLASDIVKYAGGGFYGETNVPNGIDIFVQKGVKLMTVLIDTGSFSMYVAAVSVGLLVGYIAVYTGGMIVAAKLVVGSLLSITPIVLLLFLFKGTKGIFEGWLRNIITWSIIPILVSALIAMSFYALEDGVTTIEFAIKNKGVDAISWAPLLPFLSICGVLVYCLSQITGIASNMGGGYSVQAYKAFQNTASTLRGSRNVYRKLRGK